MNSIMQHGQTGRSTQLHAARTGSGYAVWQNLEQDG